MEEAKERLLGVAKERFDRFGFKKTTMDEISRDARVSKKTIYENFKSKEDLFSALFMKEALIARKYVLKELSKYTDPLEKIRQYLLVSRKYFEKHPFMVKILQDGEGLYTPFFRTKYQVDVEEGMLEILTRMVAEAVEQKKCRNLNPRLTAYIIFKLFQSFTYAKTAANIGSGSSERDEMNELADFIIEAIADKG
ncbi:MAG: TetR/AcrR family transcriptional regulator [Methanosarcinaceae archaeon]|nr:TetR/AcrR family transcriptional regulator [Methanosarcinaceae archaeon]